MGHIYNEYNSRLKEAKLLVQKFQIEEGIALYEQIVEDENTSKEELIEALLLGTEVLSSYCHFEKVETYLTKLSTMALSPPQYARYLLAKGELSEKLGNYDPAEEMAQKALEYCEAHKDSCGHLLVSCFILKGALANWQEKIDWYNKAYEANEQYDCTVENRIACLGLMSVATQELKQATNFIEKAEAIAQNQLAYPKLWLSRLLRYRFFLTFKGESYDKGLAICKAYEQLNESVNGKLPTTEVALHYNYLSFVYHMKLDHFESVFYGQKSLILGEKFNLKTQPYSCQYLSEGYSALGNFELALKYALKSLELFKKANPTWATSTNIHDLSGHYLTIGNNYHDINKNEIALEYYLKCKEVFERTINDETNYICAPLWTNLAQLNPNVQGIEYAKKGLKTESGRDYELYIPMGDAYIALGDIDKGLESFHKGLKDILIDNNSVFDLKNKDLQFQFKSYHYAIEIIIKIGQTNFDLYVSTQEQPYLEKAIAYFDYASETISFSQKGIDEKSKISFNDNLLDIYATYIKALYAQETIDFDKILSIFEACKSNILHQNLVERKAKKDLINKDIIQKENALKTELNQLEQTLAEIEAKAASEKTEVYNQFFEKRKDYQKFITSLETTYPEYYEAKYKTETIPLSSLQSSLGEDQKLLHYLVGQEDIFILYVDVDDVELIVAPKTTTLIQDIEVFLQAIQTYNQKVYTEKAILLYKTLIEPVADLIFGIFGSDESQDLVIIPYGILSKLPFEALIKSNEKEYLLDYFDISYHYSATLWAKETKGEQAPKQIAFMGMAPIYESVEKKQNILLTSARGETYWEPLPYSKIEVDEIAQRFESSSKVAQVFFKEAASLQNLKENIYKAKYIHLAAHFHQHEVPQLSGLVLSNDTYLLIDDVYAFDLQAELIVLSACESGIGTVSNSEGMMAISRGLLYAGVQNIVTTLFAINDELTSRLMILFYEELLKENSVKKALSHAKRTLSKQKEMPISIWSAFVLIGH